MKNMEFKLQTSRAEILSMKLTL